MRWLALSSFGLSSLWHAMQMISCLLASKAQEMLLISRGVPCHVRQACHLQQQLQQLWQPWRRLQEEVPQW